MSVISSRLIPAVRASHQALFANPVRNSSSLWRPYWWGGSGRSSSVPDVFRNFDDEVDRMHKEMDRLFRYSPMAPFRLMHDVGLDLERFYRDQPIVEETGVKKYRLVFDVSRFKPEEVNVKIKDRMLSIEAKHESKTKHHEQRFEFRQQLTIPDGVKPEELTCRFSEEGTLQIEAPYNPPVEKLKAQEIPIKRE